MLGQVSRPPILFRRPEGNRRRIHRGSNSPTLLYPPPTPCRCSLCRSRPRIRHTPLLHLMRWALRMGPSFHRASSVNLPGRRLRTAPIQRSMGILGKSSLLHSRPNPTSFGRSISSQMGCPVLQYYQIHSGQMTSCLSSALRRTL
jgi:hypothetical protein